MSTSLESSLEFEVVEAHQHEEEDSNKMIVSSSSIEEECDLEEENLTSGEINARLIGRRIDILIDPVTNKSPAGWQRGTILHFDKNRDVHWILPDGESRRKEYKLGETIFRLVETEEEWVSVDEAFDDRIENAEL